MPPTDYQNPYTAPAADLTLPEDLDVPLQLAERGHRFGAAIIDSLIAFASAAAVFFILGMLAPERFYEEGDFGPITIFGYVVSWAIFLGINFHFWNTNGQSVGKLALGIKIVRSDGRKASLTQIILLRFAIMAVISSFGLLGSLIYLVNVLLIFRSECNCLYDDLAGTRVVNAR